MNNYWLERLGSLVAGGGITYATYLGTKDIPMDSVWAVSSASAILHETGPIELCALGIIVWIYAKWRKTVVVR
jgi:hypothetical protein